MHSFLLISKDESVVQKKVDEICEQHHIHILDRTSLVVEKAIGIEDIRNIQKNLSLTPIKSPLKAAIIFAADTMTIAAQNAFLKTLEEPPDHTLILLLARNKEAFLSTIISRCTIIDEKQREEAMEQKDTEMYEIFFQSLPEMSIGEKLKYAEILGKNKESALTSLETGILFARNLMLQTNQKVWPVYIRQLQKAHTLLTHTNANPRAALEHMLLSL